MLPSSGIFIQKIVISVFTIDGKSVKYSADENLSLAKQLSRKWRKGPTLSLKSVLVLQLQKVKTSKTM